MSALPRPKPMSVADYLVWEEGQAQKHEFVDGRPVAMAGASKRHNLIASNLIRHLGNRLDGKPSRPYGSDAKFISPTGNVRYPDVQVDCARLSSGEIYTTDPRVVIEVLSPSNDWIDVAKLLADYRAHESVQHILFVSSLRLRAQAFTREGDGWREVIIEDLEGGFDFPAIEARLEMAEIYDGVSFENASND